MDPQSDKKIREQLLQHLKGGEAYITIDSMLDMVCFKDLHIVPQGLPYSFYQLFFHIRLAPYDILEFSRNLFYEPSQWPNETGLSDEKEWVDS